jgi:hypothetical protein
VLIDSTKRLLAAFWGARPLDSSGQQKLFLQKVWGSCSKLPHPAGYWFFGLSANARM